MIELFQNMSGPVASVTYLIAMLNIIIHLLFAGAVARDAGRLQEIHQTPVLVSGLTWAFDTLVGGVFVAAAYWVIHHSKLTRTYG